MFEILSGVLVCNLTNDGKFEIVGTFKQLIFRNGIKCL
jgi:hypothetical protein